MAHHERPQPRDGYADCRSTAAAKATRLKRWHCGGGLPLRGRSGVGARRLAGRVHQGRLLTREVKTENQVDDERRPLLAVHQPPLEQLALVVPELSP